MYAIALLSLLAFPFWAGAQVREMDIDESAEVFLEDYSDAFQENFFEALKQKGIENYDKAINLLLECKLIDATNSVIDHELAKVYLVDKQYTMAQDYAISALLSEPENLWYLDTLVTTIQMQGSSLDQIDINIPFENNKLRENLAVIYFKQKNYEKALTILSETKNSTFTKDLSAKIKDSISKYEVQEEKEEMVVDEERGGNPIEELKGQLADLKVKNEFTKLAELSEEAMEDFPSQPYFYYQNGHALNKLGNHKAAIEVLEAALDYMLDDVPLVNKIYQELVDAHTALNNSSKANMYLRMIKPGF
jgi:tetratricopeptide (TPR) repeat protein